MEGLYDLIDEADDMEKLDAVAESMESMVLSDAEKSLGRRYLKTRRELVVQTLRALVQTLRARGEYFVDAKSLYVTRWSSLPSKEKDLMKSFDRICRPTTPSYYESIKTASEQKTSNGLLREPCLETLGTNSQFVKREKDMFDNNTDPVKAHIILDSKTCVPGWGHMGEGCTGKIDGSFVKEEKNRVRLLRVMGSKSDKENCLRRDVHNFLSLQSNHRVYFDGEPQMLVIPLCSLDFIKNWDGKTPYDVLILAASAAKDDVASAGAASASNSMTAAEVYQALLCQFDWAAFDDENDEKSGVCSEKEIRGAFSVLGHFVEAMAHSLLLEIPQDLIKQATKRDAVNNGEKISKKKGKKPSNKKSKNKKLQPTAMPAVNEGEEMDEKSLQSGAETKEDKADWWPYDKLVKLIKEERGVRLPHFQNFGRALKLRMKEEEGRPIPDPWSLMTKAGVNYSYIEYGYKILPACKPPLDESQLEYAVALQLHERRARQQDIPSSLIVPVAPRTPTTNLGGANEACVVTPPDPENEIKESDSGWEYFTD